MNKKPTAYRGFKLTWERDRWVIRRGEDPRRIGSSPDKEGARWLIDHYITTTRPEGPTVGDR